MSVAFNLSSKVGAFIIKIISEIHAPHSHVFANVFVGFCESFLIRLTAFLSNQMALVPEHDDNCRDVVHGSASVRFARNAPCPVVRFVDVLADEGNCFCVGESVPQAVTS